MVVSLASAKPGTSTSTCRRTGARSAGAAPQGVNATAGNAAWCRRWRGGGAGAGVPCRPAGLPAHFAPALAHQWRGSWLLAAEALISQESGVSLFRGASTPGHPVTAVMLGVEAGEADTRLSATARHTQRHSERLEQEQLITPVKVAHELGNLRGFRSLCIHASKRNTGKTNSSGH